MSQQENPKEERTPRNWHSHHLQEEFQDASESFHEKLWDGEEADALEDAGYAAHLFARMYKDTPLEVRQGYPATDAHLLAAQRLIESCDPFTITLFSHFQNQNEQVSLTFMQYAEATEEGAEDAIPAEQKSYRLTLTFHDPARRDGTPFDHLNMTGLPVYLDMPTPVLPTYYNGKVHFRNLTYGSVGRLRFGTPERSA